MERLDRKPRFTTGIASKITGIPIKTLINYENFQLTNVQRSESGRRLYSQRDIFDVLVINFLIKEKNLSYSGVRLVKSLRDSLYDELNYNIYRKILPVEIQNELLELIR